ncbi:MAG: hypothetical protein C0433_08970 [Cyclobacterium sp.]|nr:hypothetical protein [Cyclobacterium sp.]
MIGKELIKAKPFLTGVIYCEFPEVSTEKRDVKVLPLNGRCRKVVVPIVWKTKQEIYQELPKNA